MAGTYLITVRTSIDDIVADFGLRYRQTQGGEDSAVTQSAGVSWWSECGAAYRAILGKDARVESVDVYKITPPTRPRLTVNLIDQTGLSGGADSHSANNCMLVNLRNDQGLLKRSGRIFVSGVAKTNLQSGVWSQPFLDGEGQDFIDTLINIPPGGGSDWGGRLVVWRQQQDGVELPSPIEVDVTDVDITPELGTQHRRKGQLRGYAPDVRFPATPGV